MTGNATLTAGCCCPGGMPTSTAALLHSKIHAQARLHYSKALYSGTAKGMSISDLLRCTLQASKGASVPWQHEAVQVAVAETPAPSNPAQGVADVPAAPPGLASAGLTPVQDGIRDVGQISKAAVSSALWAQPALAPHTVSIALC